jgi:hypothetical protein
MTITNTKAGECSAPASGRSGGVETGARLANSGGHVRFLLVCRRIGGGQSRLGFSLGWPQAGTDAP